MPVTNRRAKKEKKVRLQRILAARRRHPIMFITTKARRAMKLFSVTMKVITDGLVTTVGALKKFNAACDGLGIESEDIG